MEGRRADAPCASCFFSLILPAFNEAEGIVQAIEEADAALTRLGISYEIVVVDDGSCDATAEQILLLLRQQPELSDRIRLLGHPANQGYGAALRTGFEAARGERIAFTDADCQFHLDDLAELIRLTDDHDIAVGYRQDRQDSLLRCFFSRGYNLLAGALLGTQVRDIDCALKVFRRDALARLLPESRGFFVNSEMLARARQRGFDVVEAGVRHRARAAGASKVSLTDIPKTLGALLPFWWSKVMFLGRETLRSSTARLPWAWGLLLALMAAVLFLGRLGSPLLEPEEARYAEIPRQMLAEGTFLTPMLHGEAYLHKPPLLYWLVMASYQLFGIHDWAARLVPALASIGVVLVTFAWAWRAVGPRAGWLSGLILVLCPRFVYMGGMLNFDSLLCFWLVSALATAHLALCGSFFNKRWWFLSALCCGLGLLTKGPVALALVVAPVLAWSWLERRGVRLSWRGWFTYLGVALGVAAPWFVLFALQHGQAFGDFIWLHHVVRFFDPIDHEKPFWFFMPLVIVGALPWSLLLIPLAGFLAGRSRAAARRRPAALGFFLLTFIAWLGFYSLAGCKRPAYIVCVFPILAVVLGTFLSRVPVATVTFLRNAAKPTGRQIQLARLSVGGFFGLMALGVYFGLPAYHQRFALRSQAGVEVDALDTTPVVSFPKRWDSISFYLQRDDVAAYSSDQQTQLIEDLKSRGQTLLFVKRQGALQNLLEALPPSLEFEPRCSGQGQVVAGVVRTKLLDASPKRR